jgi:hypothetical protein
MMYNNRPLNVAFEEDRSSRGRRHR